MQTILGAGGIIGTELAKALPGYTKYIQLVSRHPARVNESDLLLSADLTDAAAVKNAVKGSEIVYLTAGLPYNTRVWQQTWPVIMKNVIDACVESGSKLVFFDNIYLYDGSQLNPITETHPVRPCSKKGLVRSAIVDMLWAAAAERGLQAVIARSADFYGPGIKNASLLTETVFNPLSKGSKANWLINDNYKHSFTYTPDAGKATALLGNTPEAYGQTWHLPTAKDPLTGLQWVEQVAAAMHVKPAHRVVSKTMMKLMGIFMPVMRESVEMLYQYDKDYVFNSEKFEQYFSFTPSSYHEGMQEIIRSDYSSKL
jgi:nucleoside-diphosphate-sugar epimerase